MSKSLRRLYIASVVAIGAIALVVATLVFPAESSHRSAVGDGRRGAARHPSKSCSGLRFWIVIDATRIGASRAASTWHSSGGGDRPDLGGHVPWRSSRRRMGCRSSGPPRSESSRGRIPWYGTLGELRRLLLPAVMAGVVREALPGLVCGSVADFCGHDRGRCLYLTEPVFWSSWPACALRTEQPGLSKGPRRRLAWHRKLRRRAGSACVADDDGLRSPVVGDRAVRGFRCTRRDWPTSASSRCATCSRRRSVRWRRPSTSAIRTRPSTAIGSRRSRSTSVG